jgi:hypothetical protein
MVNFMMKTFSGSKASNRVDTASEEFALHQYPHYMSSHVAFRLMWKNLSKNDSSRSNPTWFAGTLEATSGSRVNILWKNLTPYLDQLSDLECLDGLSSLGVAELGQDPLGSCLYGHFFSTLPRSHDVCKGGAITVKSMDTTIFITNGIVTAEGPLMRRIS